MGCAFGFPLAVVPQKGIQTHTHTHTHTHTYCASYTTMMKLVSQGNHQPNSGSPLLGEPAKTNPIGGRPLSSTRQSFTHVSPNSEKRSGGVGWGGGKRLLLAHVRIDSWQFHIGFHVSKTSSKLQPPNFGLKTKHPQSFENSKCSLEGTRSDGYLQLTTS